MVAPAAARAVRSSHGEADPRSRKAQTITKLDAFRFDAPKRSAPAIWQRRNRRQPVFFGDDEYAIYRDLIATFANKARAQVLAYCLMPNHVHFVMVSDNADGLRATLGEAHRRYTRVNERDGWHGHLWQERFHSFSMDEAHFLMAMRSSSSIP